MPDEVAFEIEEGIALLDRLFGSYEELFQKAAPNLPAPNLVEMTAIASVLHSFYNGLENVFIRIAKGIDDSVPQGEHWHRALLTQMATANRNREAVLTANCARDLSEYLGFRHFYRHAYAMFLEWAELTKLVEPLYEVWNRTRHQLERFAKSLDKGQSVWMGASPSKSPLRALTDHRYTNSAAPARCAAWA